jgi:hypothetical protein
MECNAHGPVHPPKELEHYLRLLTQTIDEAKRQQLLKLLAEEETATQQTAQRGR